MAALVVDTDRIARYADLSRDHNSVHLDPAVAARSPLGRLAPHGFLLLGEAWQALHALPGPPWELHADFVAPGVLDVPLSTAVRSAQPGTWDFTVSADGTDPLVRGRLVVG